MSPESSLLRQWSASISGQEWGLTYRQTAKVALGAPHMPLAARGFNENDSVEDQ